MLCARGGRRPSLRCVLEASSSCALFGCQRGFVGASCPVAEELDRRSVAIGALAAALLLVVAIAAGRAALLSLLAPELLVSQAASPRGISTHPPVHKSPPPGQPSLATAASRPPRDGQRGWPQPAARGCAPQGSRLRPLRLPLAVVYRQRRRSRAWCPRPRRLPRLPEPVWVPEAVLRR